VLRWLAGRRRTTGVALAAVAWAASWAVVLVGGHLGGGAAAETAFIAAMVIFAVGETLFSPTLPAVINDLAPPEAAGRYNGLGSPTAMLYGQKRAAAAIDAPLASGASTLLHESDAAPAAVPLDTGVLVEIERPEFCARVRALAAGGKSR